MIILPAVDLQTITFIYGLYDPITTQLRYVGKTINPTTRYLTHVTAPHASIRNWVHSLAAVQLRPEMKILEQCNGDGSIEEVQWIEKGYDDGCDLLNRRGARVVNPSWPKCGRPKTGQAPKRWLGRVSDSDWSEIRRGAKESGKTFTRWALDLLLDEALFLKTGKDRPLF